ncbi:MAG TPA: ATP-binding protein [Bacteroidetes bacterium]|nr:ATP-binding protein [Bacteroidota bacterium]
MASQKIIGREKEKARLDKMMQSGQPEFLALYGRRRVGKTFLIREHLKERIVFDISGTREGTKEQQLGHFFSEYLLRTKGQQETLPPRSWDDAFGYLARYLAGLPKSRGKQVVFLDEMPWLDSPRSGFVHALEFFWNQHVSRMDNVLLVACGSASSWIRKHLIKARGGLYNRITQRIKLEPFNLHETQLYLHSMGVDLPQYQILELYMAMGGIPFYLQEVEKGMSAAQLIDEICFSPIGLLSEEYEQLYFSLFRHAGNHIAVVEALAARPQGMTRTQIKAATKINESQLSRALLELEECGFISHIGPLLNKKKEGIFKLIDLYSLFYLKFIRKNKRAGGIIWEQLSKQSSFTAWSGYAFENICLLHIRQIKMALGISGVFTRQSAWKFKGNDVLPGAQIDMVIDRADQIVHLCEAKFTRENFALNKAYAAKLRLRKSIFKQATKTKKAVFTTLLTTYPAIRNKYYLEEIDNEITMQDLFRS